MINDRVREVLVRIPSAWGDGNVQGHVLFVDWLIEEMQPKVTVDLGIDYGYSLIAFAHNNPGKVYGIDGFEGDEWTGTRNTYDQVSGLVTNLQLNNVTLIKGYFDDVVKTWDTKIDLLHIDGFHSYEAVKNDFEKWSGFVNSTGVILFHDTDSHDARFGVKQFFQELDMPKHELFGFQGLGIVSNNKKLMKKIKEYTP